MASGPAIEARWGVSSRELGSLVDQAVGFEAHYLGSAMINLTLTLRPQRIILGGGVMKIPGLLDAVREATVRKLAGYVDDPEVVAGIDRYLVPPGLGDDAGVLGALALAQRAAGSR